MNAIDFLTNEHVRVKQRLAEITDISDHFTRKLNLFDELAEDLLSHEKVEHVKWYPYLRDKLPKSIKHLVKEEKEAEKIIDKLIDLENDEKNWNKQFLKFKKNVELHALEEEKILFPKVEELLTANELEEIGLQMFTLKESILRRW